MAHAQSAERPFANVPAPIVPAMVFAIVLAAIVAIAALGPLGLFTSGDRIVVDPAVIESGRQWELQRKQQSGWVDPVIESGREWERQRKQQSGQDV